MVEGGEVGLTSGSERSLWRFRRVSSSFMPPPMADKYVLHTETAHTHRTMAHTGVRQRSITLYMWPAWLRLWCMARGGVSYLSLCALPERAAKGLWVLNQPLLASKGGEGEGALKCSVRRARPRRPQRSYT